MEVDGMALMKVDGRCIRMPGTVMPEKKSRQGALGKLDAIGWRQFREKPLEEQIALVTEARKQNIGEMFRCGDPKCVAKAKKIGIGRGEFAKICKKNPGRNVVWHLDNPTPGICSGMLRLLEAAKSVYRLTPEDLVSKKTILEAFEESVGEVTNNGGGWTYIRHWGKKCKFVFNLPDFGNWDGAIESANAYYAFSDAYRSLNFEKNRTAFIEKNGAVSIKLPAGKIEDLKAGRTIHFDGYVIEADFILTVAREGYVGFEYIQRMVDKRVLTDKDFAAAANNAYVELAECALGYQIKYDDSSSGRYFETTAWGFHMRRMVAEAATKLVHDWKLEVDKKIFDELMEIAKK